MTKLTKLRIHIAPVGFEIDRIVLPALEMKADKVWLIQHDNPAQEKAVNYIRKIKEELKKKKIAVKLKDADRNNLFSTLNAVKEIFNEEKGNDLYVNVSSGSKIQAIACMMACMIFKEFYSIPYYAEPEKYPAKKGIQQSMGLKTIKTLPKYEIHKPDYHLIKALEIIKNNNGKITKKQMAILAEENNLITVKAKEENRSQSRFASLDANIIKPLNEKWKFIEIKKIGKNRVIEITQEGIDATEFLI